MTIERADYCRRIESYLCRKNGGHLIRIVGPAFEQVCRWAEGGVPLNVAFRGIDRYCERYYAAGPRRRPVRIEFCEADVLELFDDWRRAVGVNVPAGSAAHEPRKPSLASHLERVVARLSAVRAGGGRPPQFDERVTLAIQEVDGLVPQARTARGHQRSAILERLTALDAELVASAVGALDSDTTGGLRREAAAELAPFASRMPPEARAAAEEAAFQRLVRETVGLPAIAFE